ncbi:hypothetical protein D3C75_987320 [compost metagenome]
MDNFSDELADVAISDAEKKRWGTAADLEFAEWFFGTIVELHELAAEYDGMISRPREPDWLAWTNEIRLLREEQGCDHQQMRDMVERIQRDAFWCPKIQTAAALRGKWPDMVLRLCPVSLANAGDAFAAKFKCQQGIPKGFRG